MKRIERYFGKSKDIELNGETITIHPLTIKNLDIVLNLAEESKRNQSMIELLDITLKKAFPEATQEEIDQVAMNYFNDLIMAIMDVNGLEPPKDMDLTKNPKS